MQGGVPPAFNTRLIKLCYKVIGLQRGVQGGVPPAFNTPLIKLCYKVIHETTFIVIEITGTNTYLLSFSYLVAIFKLFL